MKSGFLRVAAVAPRVNVADVAFNLSQTVEALERLEREGVELAVFPECGLTAYTCGDLFHSRTLLDAAEKALEELIGRSRSLNVCFIVGLPLRSPVGLLNCAAFVGGGEVRLTAKTYVPNYNEFYERRWWTPLAPGTEAPTKFGNAGTCGVYPCHGVNVGVEICEDLWVPQPPSVEMALSGAEVVCNLSASDDLIGKFSYLKALVKQQSARCLCAYLYAGAGYGESSTDLVFDGKAMIAENGTMLECARRWQTDGVTAIADVDIEALRHDRMHITTFADCARNTGAVQCPPAPQDHAEGESDLRYRQVRPRPFVPDDDAEIDERCAEIINIQTAGLARRLDFINCRSLTVGISGGLDSTLALLVAARTFDRLKLDRKGIIGVTMPGFGTTGRTHSNAVRLMELLGVTIREIPIGDAVMKHFADIGHDPQVHDVTYENSQARQRTLLLMDIANQTGGIVLGTGDLSELALGWATYNGDHMSMYGVNAGVPKTLVKWLVRWFAMTAGPESELRRVLLDILDTPVSPELLPASADGTISQRTEDLVGPYELHDFFLYYMIRYGFTPERIFMLARKAFSPDEYPDDEIRRWLNTFIRRFFSQQFKRSCLPDGPKVGSISLSPRGDWRMPSDASAASWLFR